VLSQTIGELLPVAAEALSPIPIGLLGLLGLKILGGVTG